MVEDTKKEKKDFHEMFNKLSVSMLTLQMIPVEFELTDHEILKKINESWAGLKEFTIALDKYRKEHTYGNSTNSLMKAEGLLTESKTE